MHSPLVFELFNCTPYIAARKLLNYFFQSRVFLPDDFIQARRLDSGFPELLIRPSGLNRFMLPRITYQQHAVVLVQAMEELIYLFGAGEARFIEDIKVFVFVGSVSLGNEMPLQSARLDPGVPELVGRPRSRREAFYLVTLSFGGSSDRS